MMKLFSLKPFDVDDFSCSAHDDDGSRANRSFVWIVLHNPDFVSYGNPCHTTGGGNKVAGPVVLAWTAFQIFHHPYVHYGQTDIT